jgi:hypothetical protein
MHNSLFFYFFKILIGRQRLQIISGNHVNRLGRTALNGKKVIIPYYSTSV